MSSIRLQSAWSRSAVRLQNYELRGAQSWIADEDRWDYNEVKVHLPNGDYKFEV